MASGHEVLCVNKSDRYNPHERITHIGGKNTDGKRWHITQEAAIEGIESGLWSFYVSRAGRTVDVIVAKSQYGHKYLKTVADGVQPGRISNIDQPIARSILRIDPRIFLRTDSPN